MIYCPLCLDPPLLYILHLPLLVIVVLFGSPFPFAPFAHVCLAPFLVCPLPLLPLPPHTYIAFPFTLFVAFLFAFGSTLQVYLPFYLPCLGSLPFLHIFVYLVGSPFTHVAFILFYFCLYFVFILFYFTHFLLHCGTTCCCSLPFVLPVYFATTTTTHICPFVAVHYPVFVYHTRLLRFVLCIHPHTHTPLPFPFAWFACLTFGFTHTPLPHHFPHFIHLPVPCLYFTFTTCCLWFILLHCSLPHLPTLHTFTFGSFLYILVILFIFSLFNSFVRVVTYTYIYIGVILLHIWSSHTYPFILLYMVYVLRFTFYICLLHAWFFYLFIFIFT